MIKTIAQAARDLAASVRLVRKEDLTQYDIDQIKDVMSQLHEFIRSQSDA